MDVIASRAKIWLLGAAAALAPIHAAMATVLALVIVDLVTGVLVAYKLKEPLASNKLKKTVIKLVFYEVALVLSFWVGVYLTGPSVPVLQMVASIIGLTELASLLENFHILTGNKIFATLLGRVSAHTNKDRRGRGRDDEA